MAISTGDPDWYLEEFKNQLKVTMPWLMMDTRLPNPYYQEQYDLWELIETHPTLVVLDANGMIRYRATGNGGVNENNINHRFAFDLIGELIQETKAQAETSQAGVANEVVALTTIESTTSVNQAQDGQADEVPEGWEVETKAPDFTLADLEGNEFTLSDYRGTVVVMDFWSWGCAARGDPNHVNMKAIYREYERDQVTVLSIDAFVDPDLEALNDYLTEQRIFYPVLVYGLEVSYQYRVAINPSLFIIGKSGIIRYREKTNTFDETAQEILDDLINE